MLAKLVKTNSTLGSLSLIIAVIDIERVPTNQILVWEMADVSINLAYLLLCILE